MKQFVVQIQIWLLVLLGAHGVLAQQSTIKGTLQDVSGQPVRGATVSLVENPSVRSTSDAEGTFEIPAEVGQHLKVSTEHKGATMISVRQDETTITLRNSSLSIPVGYGQIRRSDELTSAVSVFGEEVFSENGLINPVNAFINSQAPGLTVLENSGFNPTDPGLFIRGRETFNDSSPLILVDGFERPVSALSSEAIENVTVLKDAAALAVYGQRGANGVILVTTKRGDPTPLKVNVSYIQSITEPAAFPEFLDAPQYARALNEARANDGRSPRYNQTDLEGFDSDSSPYFYPNVDWFDETLRDQGSRKNMNVTFRGGGDRARYFALMHYVHDNGILGPVNRNDGYSTQKKYGRFNFRTNLDIDLTDELLFRVNVGANIIDENQPRDGGAVGDIMNALYSIPSAAFPVQTPNGNWGGTEIYGNNPVAILTSTGYGTPNSREYFIDAHLQQDMNQFIEGLRAELQVSYNNYGSYFGNEQQNYLYEDISPVRDSQGNIVDTTATQYGQNTDLDWSDSFGHQRRQMNVVGKLDYDRSFGDDRLQAMVLFHQDGRVQDGFDNVYRRRNIAGNIHYGIGDKYFFDVAASYSGNNLLPSGDRYNFFPAVSAAWLISEEAFLDDISALDLLKLRASWGISGSDRVPTDNPHVQSYNNGSGYWFQNDNTFQNGFAEGRLATTTHFTVETSYKTNMGIEAGFFEKLNVTVDLFYARRTNILTGTNGRISDIIGVSMPLASSGIVENRGVDVGLSWQDTIGDFAYHIGGQFSYAHNEIIEMNEQYRPYDYLERTGESVGQQFGLEAIGFFDDQQDIAESPRQVFSEVAPGDIKYKDQNGDGIIDEFDEVPVGYAKGYPEIYFSASMGFDYKGVGVSALFQGTGNYTAYLNTQSVYWPLRGNNTISTYYYKNRWTPETAGSATLPRLTTESNDNNFRPNSLWLVDRSYIKLRTLEVSYMLPGSLVQNWKLDHIRVFAQGRNLFSLDDIPVLDPEHLSPSYPLLRSYNVGIDIAF